MAVPTGSPPTFARPHAGGAQPPADPRLVRAGRWLRRLAWLAALALAPAHAAGADAELLAASGDVRVIRTDRGWTAMQPLVRGDALRAGDTIITGGDGRVQMRFADGALVTLQPHSRFKIDEYRFDEEGQRSFMSLLRGALRTTTGAIGKRSHADYRLRTPTATIGVRGTDYSAEETVCDPLCSPGDAPGLRVSVAQGRVVVSSRAGVVDVPAGVTVHVGSPGSLPRRESGRAAPAIRHGAPGGAAPGGLAPLPPAPGAGPGSGSETPVTPDPLPSRQPGIEARGPGRRGAAMATAGPSMADGLEGAGRHRYPGDPVVWTAGTPAGQDERAVEAARNAAQRPLRPLRAAHMGEDAAFPNR